MLHMDQGKESSANAELSAETLGDFVRRRAQAMGDAKVGVWFEEGVSLSYAELDRLADRLAAGLVSRGVRKGTHVAVMLPNIPAFPISWVALGRIGAVMVPVNTSYTAEELNFVLTDSDSQFFILQEDFLSVLLSLPELPELLDDSRIIVMGQTHERHANWQQLCETAEPFIAPSRVQPDDLLNIQYTSGTTGFPKGCMLSHDYWTMAGKYASSLHRGSDKIQNTLIWAPFYYMDPMWQFLLTMNLGATAYVAKRMSLSRFFDWLEEYRIHYCIFPEPALKACPPSSQDGRLALKYVSIYGWRKEARREVQERFGVVAREGYGMTEIGLATDVPYSAAEESLELTCGRPSPFRKLKVVDDQGAEVPDGEIGELWVSGRSLLWGYYKRPLANADSFRGVWFRTGDLFRRDGNGYYYIVGRIKDMVKRSGENISAHEVEKALCAMQGIAEAAIIAVPDDRRREEVKAFILPSEGTSPDEITPAQIIEHCRTRLAEFKVPRFISFVEEFPRTASRKIRKQPLRAGELVVKTWDRESGQWD